VQAGSGSGPGKIQSGINVTPLVDVALVLLITYMVITAMIRQGVNVEVPIAAHATNRSTADQDKLTTVAINEEKAIFLNLKPMADVAQLERELMLAYRGHEGQPVILKGAKNLEYGDILSLMNTCRQIGVAEVELMAKKADSDEG
jgi:biopolymer transport protein TolR